MKNHIEKLRELQRQLQELDIDQLANTLKELKGQIDILVQGIETLEREKGSATKDKAQEFWENIYLKTKQDRAVLEELRAWVQLFARGKKPGMLIGPGVGNYTEVMLNSKPIFVLDRVNMRKLFLKYLPEPTHKNYRFYITKSNNGSGSDDIPFQQFDMIVSVDHFVHYTVQESERMLIYIRSYMKVGGNAIIHYPNNKEPLDRQKIQSGDWEFNDKETMEGLLKKHQLIPVEHRVIKPGYSFWQITKDTK
jgi:hypothetical protein